MNAGRITLGLGLIALNSADSTQDSVLSGALISLALSSLLDNQNGSTKQVASQIQSST